VGLERGPLSLVGTTEELLERKSSGSDLENREYCRRDPSHWPRDTLYPQKLALTSPESGSRSVSIVLLRTQATEFFFKHHWLIPVNNNKYSGPVKHGKFLEQLSEYFPLNASDTWGVLHSDLF
jgi:hypothetical protein